MGDFRLSLVRGLMRAGMGLQTRWILNRPFPQQRAILDGNAARFFKVSPGVKVESISAGGLPADCLTPVPCDEGRAILYLHGGGYTTGSPATHRDLAARIALAARARVYLLDYRLAPEHPFPAALDDALAACRWLYANGQAPSRLALAGDSAGGGLTVSTLVALRDAGDPLPAAAVCISPWADLAFTGGSAVSEAARDPVVSRALLQPMAEAYLAGGDVTLPLASPLYADLRGLPPLLIQAGEHEILRDDAVRLAERAHGQGVEANLTIAPGLWHIWHVAAAFLPEARQAIAELGEFVARRTWPHDALSDERAS